jgi:endonuclease/exonuclease/phosphatase family metal-dependent hydrolase
MLTFLSFNIGNFRKEQAQELVQYLLPTGADCVGLQEVHWVNDSSMVAILQQSLQLPYIAIGHSKNTTNHVLLLSRFPISKQDSFDTFANAGLLATIEAPEHPITLCLVHLAPHSENTRVNELSILLEALQGTTESVIIMGDLNAIAKNDPVEYTGELAEPVLYNATSLLMEAGFVDVGAAVANNFIGTVPITRDGTATYTNLRLDYFYLSSLLLGQKPTYTVLKPQNIAFPSDHHAIVTTVYIY